ncbi:hypothetical protein [Methylobacterium sp. 1030]|uniref:hypothetical protein n=1 Tax=Methylobacterium sp. 1030 TaxID=3156404 RepID=UPI003392B347
MRKAAVDARLDEAVRAGAPIREVYDLIQESACLFEALELRRDGLCRDADPKPGEA